MAVSSLQLQVHPWTEIVDRRKDPKQKQREEYDLK